MGLIIISVIFGLVGSLVSGRLKSKFSQYSKMPLQNGMPGSEVARAMLEHYGINDVKIVEGRGTLTDHYNPQTKTVSLSPDVYRGRHVSAAAVAAHECGHAVQHATAYSMLQFRSAMVPLVQVSSKMQQFIFMFGFAMMGLMNNSIFLLVALAAFAVTTLFSLITLPVEFDASRRALAWLDNSNFARGREYDGAKDALKWAALTYVVGAVAAVAQLLYFLMIFLNSRD